MLKVLKNRYLPFLFAMPLFFCVHHYSGIVIDAILYVTQYVYSLDPARFLGDPAFEFGNQDSLGFFSPFFGLFLDTMGVAKGAFVYTLLMQLAWVVCAVFMIKQLLRLIGQRLWILPVTILFLVFFANGMGFSHSRFFHYVSSYACSRSLSIALGMTALALIFNQKKIISLLFILVGTAVHPITAGWCLPFWMFYFFPKTKIHVLVASLLFPLTFVLHSGRFDFLSQDWLSRPLEFAPRYDDISCYILLLVYFGVLLNKSKSVYIQKISSSLIPLIAIMFYWDIWGGYGEHVLLYQTQPWRGLWLPSLVAVPLGICVAKDVVLKLEKNKVITSHDFAMLLLVASFLVPYDIVLVPIISAVLLVREEKKIVLKNCVAVFAGFVLGGYLVQQYHTWCVQGFDPFLGYDYRDVYLLRDSFLVYQLVFAVGFAAFFMKRRKFVLAALMVGFVFLSRFMLLPLLPLYLYFFPKENKAKCWMGALVIIVLTVFDGMFDVETRRMTLFDALPLCFPWVCCVTIASFASIYLSRRFAYVGIVVWLLTCSAIAVADYYTDCEKSLETEMQLDLYLRSSIFPQVKERGKMLFYVSGDYVNEPRLQFMTGSYFSHSVMVGSVFSKEHYRTALERSLLLYERNLNPQSDKFYDFSDILGKFADVDTLVDRVKFLCGLDEITHLVTDKADLSFPVEDSVLIPGGQKVFLYGCPIAEKQKRVRENESVFEQ